MNPPVVKTKPYTKSDTRSLVAFIAMLASVLLICQGLAFVGLPAFVLSLSPFLMANG